VFSGVFQIFYGEFVRNAGMGASGTYTCIAVKMWRNGNVWRLCQTSL